MQEPDPLAAVRAGDMDAFVAMVRRHARHMLGVAQLVTYDRELAEQAVSEAAVAAWRGRAFLHGDVEGVLGRLARRSAQDLVRRGAA